MNNFSDTGRIGRDVEVRQAGQSTVAGFPLAVDTGYGDNKQTIWLDCSLWGRRAESGLMQYLVKGQEVHVSGELGTREFQKRDGSQGFAVTLRVSDLKLVGGSKGGGQQPQRRQEPNYGGYQQEQANYAARQNQAPQQPGGMMDDDMGIPF